MPPDRAEPYTQFFPPTVLGETPALHAFRDRWYSAHLMAMREPPLYPAGEHPLTYRLLYLPTFDPPAAVRLTWADGWTLTTKRSDGRGGYEPGLLKSESTRVLISREARRFEKLVVGCGLWAMPTVSRELGADGTECVVEAVRSGTYHVVDRWSPRGTPFAALVEFLIALVPPDGGAAKMSKYLGSFREVLDRLRGRD